MSLGVDGCWSSALDTIETRLMNELMNAGVSIVVAMGNSKPNNFLSTMCFFNALAAPARVISVGNLIAPPISYGGQEGWSINKSSGRGPRLDSVGAVPTVSAPGTTISAARAGTVNGYVAYTGTSQAAPFVSGLAAGMLDANPYLSVAQIKDYIANYAETTGGTKPNNVYGSGYVRAFETYKALLGSSSTWDDGYNHYDFGAWCIRTGSLTYTFARPTNNKVISGTVAVHNYSDRNAPTYTPSLRVDLKSPDNSIYRSASGPASTLSVFRFTSGLTGKWKVQVSAIDTQGQYACYYLDVTD